jgi:hypothetical protein
VSLQRSGRAYLGGQVHVLAATSPELSGKLTHLFDFWVLLISFARMLATQPSTISHVHCHLLAV